MSKKRNGVNYSKAVQKRSRRERALARLQRQLVMDEKLDKAGHKHLLNDKDKARIHKEMEILKSRV